MSDQPGREFRTVITFTVAARIAVLVAALLLIAAAYMYWVPLTVPNPTGAPLRCRTAASPPTDDFAKAFCGSINTIFRYRALALLAGALVVGIGGFFLLGERRVVSRVSRETPPPAPPADQGGPYHPPEDGVPYPPAEQRGGPPYPPAERGGPAPPNRPDRGGQPPADRGGGPYPPRG